MRSLLPALLVVPLASACTNGAASDDSASATANFCTTLNDAGLTTSAAEGGNDTSGILSIRVLTSESVDPQDPLYVAFKNYTLENLDSGGVKTTGKTTGDGLVEVMLGAGTWDFQAVYTRGSLTCSAQIEALVEPNATISACPVMNCP